MSKFLANVLKLGSATLLGQIIGFIITPVLTRLYTPADFGVYQLFISMVTFIAIISCLSYHGAINLPKKHEDGASIVTLCLLLIAITSVLATIFFFVFSDAIGTILNAPRLSNYLFLVPLAILCNSVAFVLAGWLSRKEDFGTMATANIVSSITGKSVSVGAGVISPSPFGLIFGTITNDATIVTIALKKTAADFQLFRTISFEQIREIAFRYKNFPQYNAVSNLANTAGVQSTPLLLAFFFSPIIVGYYAMAHLVINLPLRLVGNSLASVFYQKACVEKNLTGSVKNIVGTVHTRLISIGMFASLTIMITGPELFAFFFGDRWYIAGIYAQILMPWFFVVFISVPLLMIYSVLEMQNISLWFNVVNLILKIVVLVIGGILSDPVTLMILLSVTGVVSWGWMNMHTLKIAGVGLRGATYEIVRYLLFGLFFCVPIIIAKYYSVQSTLLVLITIAVSLLYYLIIIYQDVQLKQGLLDFVGSIIQK